MACAQKNTPFVVDQEGSTGVKKTKVNLYFACVIRVYMGAWEGLHTMELMPVYRGLMAFIEPVQQQGPK